DAEQREPGRRDHALPQLVVGETVALSGQGDPLEIEELGERRTLADLDRRGNTSGNHALSSTPPPAAAVRAGRPNPNIIRLCASPRFPASPRPRPRRALSRAAP